MANGLRFQAGTRSSKGPITSHSATVEGVRYRPDTAGLMTRRESLMPTIEQCRAYAAEHKILGGDPKNSARRSTVLLSISHSWTALAHQLESLADIEKSER